MNDKHRCYLCKQIKPKSEFHKNNKRVHGCSGRCKPCHAEYMRKYQKGDKWKAAHVRKQAAFIKKHPERNVIYRLAQKVGMDDSCSRCGVKDKRLVRHHPDYSKPQDILTVCDKCHRAIHKELLNVD